MESWSQGYLHAIRVEWNGNAQMEYSIWNLGLNDFCMLYVKSGMVIPDVIFHQESWFQEYLHAICAEWNGNTSIEYFIWNLRVK